MRRKVAIVTVLGLLTLVAGLSYGGGMPALATSVSVEEPLNDVTLELSAKQMVVDYGVALSEARARMLRQADMFALAERVHAKLRNVWSGSYLDQSSDGHLVLLGTNRDAIEQALSQEPDSERQWARARQVSRSETDLMAIQAQLEDRLKARHADYAGVQRDLKGNRVGLDLVSEAGAEAAGESAQEFSDNRRRADDARAPYGDAVVVREVPGKSIQTSCSSTTPICNDPIRGGPVMGAPVSGDEMVCSMGFNVRSRSPDHKHYLLTAGHCNIYNGAEQAEGSDTGNLTDGTHWRTKMVKDSVFHWIGYWWNGEAVADHDAGIISVDNVSGWNPGPYVLVRASSNDGGARTTAYNELYPISSVRTVDASSMGGYLCTTGAAKAQTSGGNTWTRCGQLIGLGYDTTVVHNLGVLDLDSCQGDSGGPIFSGNAGYGIQSSVKDDSISYSLGQNFGWFTQTAQCGTTTLYQGLNHALDAMNVDLITSP